MSIHLDRLDHAFHYISQWDPHKSGTTKGGYIQGVVEVPCGCSRIILNCVPHERRKENVHDIQPCLLHIVFKESDRKRNKEKEAVPSFERWKLRLDIVGRNVVTKDKHGEDYKVAVMEDGKIVLGDKGDNLNLVILFPKTDSRGENQRQEFIKTILRGKGVSVTNELVDQVNVFFVEDQSVNLHRMRIFAKFLINEDSFISSCRSEVILNNKNKMVGALSFSDAFPLKSCTRGGRRVMMISDFPLSKDVMPIFLLYDKEGNRHPNHENLISQPTQYHMQNNCMIILITPPQERIHLILKDNLQVKLAGCRGFDGYQSQSQFPFEFVPHQKKGNCMFCDGDPDGSQANIGGGKTRPTKGCPKRKMTNMVKQVDSFSAEEDSRELLMPIIPFETNSISSCKSPLNSLEPKKPTSEQGCIEAKTNLETTSRIVVPDLLMAVSHVSDKKNQLDDSDPKNSHVLQNSSDCNNVEIPSTVQDMFAYQQSNNSPTEFNITSEDITNLLNILNPPKLSSKICLKKDQSNDNSVLQQDNFGIPLDLSFDLIPMVNNNSSNDISSTIQPSYYDVFSKRNPSCGNDILSSEDNSHSVVSSNSSSISPPYPDTISPILHSHNLSSISPSYGDSISFNLPSSFDEISPISSSYEDTISPVSSIDGDTYSSTLFLPQPNYNTLNTTQFSPPTIYSFHNDPQMYPTMSRTYIPSHFSSDEDISQLDGHMSPNHLLVHNLRNDIIKSQITPLLSSPQLYCLAEILNKMGYVDDDPDDTLLEIVVKIVPCAGATVLETVCIPYKDRESGGDDFLCRSRKWDDYFPSRTTNAEISTLILHRFGGALDKTISSSLLESFSSDYDAGKRKLSRPLLDLLQQGRMMNYLLINTSQNPILWRISHPARTKPQSVGVYNNHCVTALVQTTWDQDLPCPAFDLLMDTICNDLASCGAPPPQYLASFQEIRGGGPEGNIGNIKELRRRSWRKHCRENQALFQKGV